MLFHTPAFQYEGIAVKGGVTARDMFSCSWPAQHAAAQLASQQWPHLTDHTICSAQSLLTGGFAGHLSHWHEEIDACTLAGWLVTLVTTHDHDDSPVGLTVVSFLFNYFQNSIHGKSDNGMRSQESYIGPDGMDRASRSQKQCISL